MRQDTYVNKDLLDLPVSGYGLACHVLMPEPRANGLQRSVGTAPPTVTHTILQSMNH